MPATIKPVTTAHHLLGRLAVPQVCEGLSSILAACETDQARIWIIRLMGNLVKILPAAWQQQAAHGAFLRVLNPLWAWAVTEDRQLLLRELRWLSKTMSIYNQGLID